MIWHNPIVLHSRSVSLVLFCLYSCIKVNDHQSEYHFSNLWLHEIHSARNSSQIKQTFHVRGEDKRFIYKKGFKFNIFPYCSRVYSFSPVICVIFQIVDFTFDNLCWNFGRLLTYSVNFFVTLKFNMSKFCLKKFIWSVSNWDQQFSALIENKIFRFPYARKFFKRTLSFKTFALLSSSVSW